MVIEIDGLGEYEKVREAYDRMQYVLVAPFFYRCDVKRLASLLFTNSEGDKLLREGVGVKNYCEVAMQFAYLNILKNSRFKVEVDYNHIEIGPVLYRNNIVSVNICTRNDWYEGSFNDFRRYKKEKLFPFKELPTLDLYYACALSLYLNKQEPVRYSNALWNVLHSDFFFSKQFLTRSYIGGFKEGITEVNSEVESTKHSREAYLIGKKGWTDDLQMESQVCALFGTNNYSQVTEVFKEVLGRGVTFDIVGYPGEENYEAAVLCVGGDTSIGTVDFETVLSARRMGVKPFKG